MEAACLGVFLLLTVSIAVGVVGAAQLSPPVAPDLVGTWAEMQTLSEFATLPLVGQVARTTTVILHVTIEQTASSLVLRQTYCSTDMNNGSAIATTLIPDALLRSLGEVAALGSIDASVMPTQFVQPWTTEVRGARLDDPERDPLPTRADDVRVVDQDGDGNPGLTVHVSALGFLRGDVYVVQRVRTRLVGALVSVDRIEGLIESTTEQVTLAATSLLFLGALPSRPDPIAEHSTFVLVRINPAWECADILAHRVEIFGR